MNHYIIAPLNIPNIPAYHYYYYSSRSPVKPLKVPKWKFCYQNNTGCLLQRYALFSTVEESGGMLFTSVYLVGNSFSYFEEKVVSDPARSSSGWTDKESVCPRSWQATLSAESSVVQWKLAGVTNCKFMDETLLKLSMNMAAYWVTSVEICGLSLTELNLTWNYCIWIFPFHRYLELYKGNNINFWTKPWNNNLCKTEEMYYYDIGTISFTPSLGTE